MRPSEVARKLKAISVGEFIEIPCPPKTAPYRSAVALMCGCVHFAARKSMDGCYLRFYRTGDWGIFGDEIKTTRAKTVAKSIPVIWHNIVERLAKRPPIYWFGLLGGSLGPSMHRKEAKKLVWPCGFRGCPFPRVSGEFCFRHAHFEEIAYLMEGRVDLNDILPSKEIQQPALSTMLGYELDRNDFVLEYRGRREWDLPKSGGIQQFNEAPSPGHAGIFGNERNETCRRLRRKPGLAPERYSEQKTEGLLPAVSESLRCAPTRPDLGKSHSRIEIEEKYCEIAAKRLSQEVLEFSTSMVANGDSKSEGT